MTAPTITQIFQLNELEVYTMQELQWAVEYRRIRRIEAQAQVAAAWDMYSAAIDDCLERDSINELGKMAEKVEAAAADAYIALDAAKAALLARMN